MAAVCELLLVVSGRWIAGEERLRSDGNNTRTCKTKQWKVESNLCRLKEQNHSHTRIR
jgi:hypothetical protein